MRLKHFRLANSLENNLRLIAWARLVLWVCAQIVVLLNYFVWGVEISLFWAEFILMLLALSAALTFYPLFHSPNLHAETPPQANNLEQIVRLHLISDVLILTLLFHVTGGAANPFVSILLFPLIVSASILPGRFSWWMVLLTLSCYGSLFWSDTLAQEAGTKLHMEHSSLHMHHSEQNDSAFSLHIIGMWFNFAISAILISFFVVRMRQEIDQQQKQLTAQREQALRDEQLLGIATQAASAAHHLGTPLSTMSVILHDLKQDPAFPESYLEEVSTLCAQVANCKAVLQSLRHQAEAAEKMQPVVDFITTLVNEFHLLQPATKLTQLTSLLDAQQTYLPSDPALRMAILNIMKNAADASPEKIQFETRVVTNFLLLEITDFGPGFDGQHSFLPADSAKQEGLGIGLFLSHATINRYQGEIHILQTPEGGTKVRIKLPHLGSANTD